MISRTRIDCRILLIGSVSPGERLQLMEIIEKWVLALTGTKPSRFLAASNQILFSAPADRRSMIRGLRTHLPAELIRDVIVGGASWNE